MNLKSTIAIIALTIAGASVKAQDSPPKQKKNVSKTVIFPGPFFRMFGVQQEFAFGKRFSTVTTVKAMPPVKAPGGFTGGTYDEETYDPFAGAKLSGFGNVTEFRIYGKKKGMLRGFYFGPYFTGTFYKLQTPSVPAQFKDESGTVYTADVTQTVKVNVVGGGLQIGVQGLIKNLVAIDWTILGIGFGSCGLKGGVEATNTSDNFDFRNYSADVDKTTLGLDKFLPVTKTVEKEKVELGVKAPVPLFRMSLSIGIAY